MGFGVTPASLDCFNTFTNGVGANKIEVCLSNHGNVIEFESPAGPDHMKTEGYGVCANEVYAYDVGHRERGWVAPTKVQPNGPNTLPLKIMRRTSDGDARLDQEYLFGVSDKELTIKMTLNNLSSSMFHNVQLSRSFDANIDGMFDNYIAETADSVSLWLPLNGHGVNLKAKTMGVVHDADFEWAESYYQHTADQCVTAGESSMDQQPLDVTGRVTYFLGTIPAGGSKSVTVEYSRI
jgi:hypothetical protein